VERLSWVGLGWGEAGGAAAREVALWVALQREFHRRGVLPSAAVRRLSLLGLQWEPQARALPRAVCHAPARPLAGELLAALAAPQRGSQPCLSCRSAADAARRATWHAEPRSLLAVLTRSPSPRCGDQGGAAASGAACSTLDLERAEPHTLYPCALLQDGEAWQRAWMAQLGRVAYLVERYKRVNAAAASAEAQVPRPGRAAPARSLGSQCGACVRALPSHLAPEPSCLAAVHLSCPQRELSVGARVQLARHRALP